MDQSAGTISDDFAREVYCVLGMPIDAIEMPAVLHTINAAAAEARPFVISTPNLNFLVNSLVDPVFANSLLLSNLCPPDGIPIVWIARLIGVPIKKRVAGSDIFEALKAFPRAEGPLKIFLFGGTEEAAAAASRRLNQGSMGLTCVGWACPGFGTMDDLSQDQFFDQINASNADFLVAALGAQKGQLWLQRNHDRLRIPIRAHLGATINFQAGLVRRAPRAVQKLGLEWLWRIKEEPYLWRRYWRDGVVLLRLLVSRVLPIAADAMWLQGRRLCRAHDLDIAKVQDDHEVTLRLVGYAIAEHVPKAVGCFRDALASRKQVVIDFSETRLADARFFGLLLMLKKQAKNRGVHVRFVGTFGKFERQCRLNGLEFLLCSSEKHTTDAS